MHFNFGKFRRSSRDGTKDESKHESRHESKERNRRHKSDHRTPSFSSAEFRRNRRYVENLQGLRGGAFDFKCIKCNQKFRTKTERDNHFKTSRKHKACKYCDPIIDLGSVNRLHQHYKIRHKIVYCHFCDEHFANLEERTKHFENFHPRCEVCLTEFARWESLNAHYKNAHPGRVGNRSEFKKPLPTSIPTARRVGHYATLCISPQSSQEQVLKAAKEMRVKTHPDRLKRQKGLTEEQKQDIDKKAALVGQAADILSDPDLRRKYDQQTCTSELGQGMYRRW